MKIKSINLYKISSLLVLGLLMLVCLTSCFENKLNVENYLSAVKDTSSVTRVIQTTTISDGAKLVSKLSVDISVDGDKVKSEVYKKMLSQDLSAESDYTESTENAYFCGNDKYSYDGTNWVKEEGTYASSLKTIDIRKDDLDNLEFTQTVKDKNVLSASVKQESLKAIFGDDFAGSNCTVEIELNQKSKIISLNITYFTSTNKKVEIKTNYSYEFVQIDLPNV